MKIMAIICKLWDPTSNHKKRIVHIVLLAFVGLIIYSNSLNVPFIMDDNYSIEFFGRKNLIEHMLQGGFRRVVNFTFGLNYRIHGLVVTGYHLTNLVIHISSSILLYFIVVSSLSALRVSFKTEESAIGSVDRGLAEQWFPLSVALLFVSHPVQTQAVTYIIQRYTSLATFFYLLSIFSFIKARLAFEKGCHWRDTWIPGGGALVAGLLAVGSKEIAITLPYMLLLLECFLFRGRLINRRFFVYCGVCIGIIVALVLVKLHGSSLDYLLIDLHRATAEDLYTSRTTYFLTQTRVIATYLSLLFLPIGQSIVRDYPIYNSLFSLPVVASLIAHIFIFSAAVALFKRSRYNFTNNVWTSGVYQRLASFGIFWFYGAMVVESSIFPIRDVFFEHRIYLPSIGFFITIAAIVALTVQSTIMGTKVAWISIFVVCSLLSGMTIIRNKIWSDPLTLWQEAVSKSPNKWLALSNLAEHYLYHKMPEKALPLYVRTLELQSDLYPILKVHLGDSMKALNIFASRFTTGQEWIIRGGDFGIGTIDYNDRPKWDGVINNNIGLAYEYLKAPEKAKNAYQYAVTKNPAYDLAWFNLALLSSRLGDKDMVDAAMGHLQILNQPMARDLNMILKSKIIR